MTDFLRKHEVGLQILLILVAAVFLSFDINHQFVDYDEATYAKVVVDTLQSGNFLDLELSGHHWFEKPPLYLWLAMGTVKIFGVHEFAFRLPSILAAILCCWLVYLLIKEFTRDQMAAAIGFLTLLFSGPFWAFAREARLDSSVVAAILAALLFTVKGWKNEKYLFWVFPCIAIGFLFKSVIVLLAIPIILFYSLMYHEWSYVKSKYLWWGFLLALAIVIPWHLVESVRFGELFWRDYLGRQVFQRAFSTLTGTNNYGDYFMILVSRYVPFNLLLIFEIIYLFDIAALSKEFKRKIIARDVAVPLVVALFIVTLFTFARTHLQTYIMPAFPFLAMSIAIAWYHIVSIFPKYKNFSWLPMLPPLAVSAVLCFHLIPFVVPPFTLEEKDIGQFYKAQHTDRAPLYVLDWLVLENFNYYGNTQAQTIDPRTIGGKIFHGPFFLVTRLDGVPYFFDSPEKPKYPGLKLISFQHYFALIYAEQDITMPVFQYRQ